MEILIVSDDGFEEAVVGHQEPGHGVTLAAPRVGTLTGKHGYPMRADVALEAVDRSKQVAMDQLAEGSLKPRLVEPATDWSSTWGHAFKPYLKVFKTGMAVGATFVGVGLPVGPAPDDRELKVPERYITELGATASEHGMDPNVFANSMAWRDLAIARRPWSGGPERGSS